MDNDKDGRFLIIFALVFIIVAGLYSAGNFKLNEIIRLESLRQGELENNLASLELEAKAVAIYNLMEDRKIFGRNDDLPLPIASLTKTMTIAVALSKLGTEARIPISVRALQQAGDYKLLLADTWPTGELAKLTLVASANDGAYALAEAAGGDTLLRMNEKARKIGMNKTVFLNVTGLDKLDNGMPVEASGFASAEDLNILAYYALRLYPDIFQASTLPEVYGLKNTNPTVGSIPGLLFSKTGFTDLSGGNLTIIFRSRSGDLIAATILGSSYDGRFTDMEKIVGILYNL